MVEARWLVVGPVDGVALVLDEPLSVWGGLDALTGAIIERRHPQFGQSVRGRVLVMPAGRGSSSSASVLAEAIRSGTGPAAILLAEPDEIVVIGALVVQLLDGTTCPVAVLPEDDYRRLRSGDHFQVDASGDVQVAQGGSPAS